MNIDLCFKTYPIKMSFEACRQYEQRVKGIANAPASLDGFMFDVAMAFYNSDYEQSALERLSIVYSSISKEAAAIAIHCLIDDSSIDIKEIEDGMQRVGWMPVDDDMKRQPWPIVVYHAFNQISAAMKEVSDSEKKRLTGNHS